MKTPAFIFLVFSLSLGRAQTVSLEAETNHSTIEFFVGISEGLTKISGKFTDFKISLEFVDSSLVKSRINVSINPASINTGIPARDEDLKSADFFDIVKFPEISFHGVQIIQDGINYRAVGKCTLHGVTKDLSIPFKVTGVSKNYVIGFSGQFTLKRSDYTVGTTWKHTTDDHFIADDIDVHVDFWTRKPKLKK
jgi:polyisoprenoid-binding protein YceI